MSVLKNPKLDNGQSKDNETINKKVNPTILGSNERKVRSFFIWDRAYKRNKWLVLGILFLILVSVSVVIYVLAATISWTNSNQWKTWSYATNAAAPVTHTNTNNLTLQLNSKTLGYRPGNYALYRLDVPGDVSVKSISFNSSYSVSGYAQVYLAVDTPDNKVWTKSNKRVSQQSNTVLLNGQHTLYFGISLSSGFSASSLKQSQYLLINSYTLKGDQVSAGDTIPPNVSLTSPSGGAAVAGIVKITADASDDIGLASVLFRVDGTDIGTPINTSPYSIDWDSAQVASGNHTLTAVAQDTSGNTTVSAALVVSVNNIVPTPQTILWQSGMENGTLSDWYMPVTSSASVNGVYPGGGEFDSGTGYGVASNDLAHSGSWSLKSILPDGIGANRMFRWLEPRENQAAFYSTWLYIPQNYTLTANPSTGQYWNVMQFKSISNEGRNDPVWTFVAEMHPDGKLHIYPAWGYGGTQISGPTVNDDVSGKTFAPSPNPLPVNKWIHLEAYMKQSNAFDGEVKFWVDEQLIYSVNNVRTGYNNCKNNTWCVDTAWSINEYSDGMTPFPSYVYFDDVKIWK